MIKRLKFVFIVWLLLVTPVFGQSKVDVISLNNGVTSTSITIGATATKLPTTNLSGRRVIIIVNISSNTVYIGNENVTTANGFALFSNQAISADIGDTVNIYGISTVASEVRILEAR